MSQRNVNSTGVSHWLIHRAACHAPPSFAERLEEEWLADLAQRSGAVSQLRFALGCCWATWVIAREYQPAAIPVSSSAIQAGCASVGFADVSRRSSTLFWVVSLHAGVFYILMTTVLHVPKLNHDPLDMMPTITQPPDKPSIGTPEVQGVTIFAQSPVIPIPPEHDPNPPLTVQVEPDPPAPPQGSIPHTTVHLQGGPGTGFPDPDDFYPVLARHMEEQGVATVQVCVDTNGRLTSAPTTLQGTGSSRLDQGALKLARAGSGHYRATTDDGQAVNSCFPFRVRFQLKN